MTDTHFHFSTICERKIDGAKLLESLCQNKTRFILDIGTKNDDLENRQKLFLQTIKNLSKENQKKAQEIIFFAAGIWPSIEEIENRKKSIQNLLEQIEKAKKSENPFQKKICAIGECGLDHYENPNFKNQKNFSQNFLAAEEELFEMQLDMAKKFSLPVVVHSREAAKETISCIKNAKTQKGVIHCFSYGLDEARIFLDLGFYISFSGGITYTKKNKFHELENLLNFLPKDRILIETDSPYLAPVPHRGKTNTPLFVDYVYDFVAKILKTDPISFENLVTQNAKKLFGYFFE